MRQSVVGVVMIVSLSFSLGCGMYFELWLAIVSGDWEEGVSQRT